MSVRNCGNDIDQSGMENRAGNTPWIRWISTAAAVCLLVTLLFSASNSAPNVSAENLMEGISPRPVEVADLGDGTDAVLVFSAQLMRKANRPGENTLISPLSTLYALAMTANGARGETLEEMEAVLGMSVEDLNIWLYSYGKSLESQELQLANSIWFSSQGGFQVNREFLQHNADYYGVDLYKAPFNDSTVHDINRWVDQKTKGMIPQIVDDVDDALMVLINTLCFEAAWEDKYEDFEVDQGTFTMEDGTHVAADFLRSKEKYFLQDNDAKGFIKYYKGRRYAFLAMLPNEDVTVEQYVNSLTGYRLEMLLDSIERMPVKVTMPEFETECTFNLTDTLVQMGIKRAFDSALADFSGIGSFETYNLYIDQVRQKTYICVDKEGTRAAAETDVIILPGSAPPSREEEINLDRPYVYMLMDMQTGIPVFIGTMMNPGA